MVSDDPLSCLRAAPTEPSVPTTGKRNCPRCDQCLPIDSFARKHGRTLRSRDSTICKECLKQQHLKDGKAFVCDDCNEIVDGTSIAKKTLGNSEEKDPICKPCAQTRRMLVKNSKMLLCHGCKQMLNKHRFQGIIQQGDKDRLRCCRDCTMKKIILLCHGCKNILEKNTFSPSEWEGDTQKSIRCRSCTENPKQLLCHGCDKHLSKQFFSKAAWRGAEEKVRHCSSCNERRQKRLCHGCENYLSKQSFSKAAWKGAEKKVRRCSSCNESRQKRLCHGCGNYLRKQSFGKAAWKGADQKVRHCSSCNENRQNEKCQKQLCHGCEKYLSEQSFSQAAWKGEDEKVRQCSSCNETRQKQLCHGCEYLSEQSFSQAAWKGEDEKVRQCSSCNETRQERLCHGCQNYLSEQSFSEAAWKGEDEKVRQFSSCNETRQERLCHGCQNYLSEQSFSQAAWKGNGKKARHCSSCNESCQKQQRQERLCHGCRRRMGRYAFTKGAWVGDLDEIRYCCGCTEKRRQLIWNASETMQDVESSVQGVKEGHEERAQLNCTDGHNSPMLRHQCEKLMDKDSIGESALEEDGLKIQIFLSCAESYQPQPCIGCTKMLSKKSLSDGAEKGDSRTGPFCLSCTRMYTLGKRQELSSRQQYGKVRRASAAEVSQWLSMRRCRGNEGQQNVVLRWPSASISTTDEIAMKAKIIVRGQYASLTRTERDNLASYIRESSSAMTLHQACSLRRQILRQKSYGCLADLDRNAPQLVSLYNGGMSIVALSQRFDAPPLNVLRAILNETGYDKFQMKKAFHRPERFFEARGLKEFKEAIEADFVGLEDTAAAQEVAKHFEDCVAAYLREKGIRFVHETQLAEEQIDILGKVLMAPDFLILDDLEINGKKVRWIDAKACYGEATTGLIERTRHQMRRYIGEWGPGAIVFKNGFGEEFSTALEDVPY